MTEMEIEQDDDMLNRVAQDGSMDYSLWPTLLPVVVARIEKIAHTEFPIPHIPPPQPPVRHVSPRFIAPLPASDPIEAPDSSDTVLSSQEINKENASPPSSPTLSSAKPRAPQQQQPEPEPLAPGALPIPVAALLGEITAILTLNFPDYPPHTIQRLAELVLRPRQHYRSLVAYLHALDRIVHVTSGANIYPLPPAIPDKAAMTALANGVAGGAGGPGALTINTAAANNIGSDEALGGALLTPIPWLARRANGGGSDSGTSDAGSSSPLSATSGGISSGSGASQNVQMQQQQQQQQRQVGTGGRKLEAQVRTESTETIEGPNGMGSIETVSISVNGYPSMGTGASLTQRGVTQGELLRQEQRAGVVPLSQITRQQQQSGQGSSSSSGAAASSATADEDAPMAETEMYDINGNDNADDDGGELPHARGPEEIGAADMGPQSITTSYMKGPSGVVDMQGIDVEAAVGRRMEPISPSPEQKTSSSSSPEALIPRSPKREAVDEIETAVSKKRIKEDDSAASSVEEMVVEEKEQEAVGAGSAAAGTDADELKRDAEGDVVIRDPSPPIEAQVDTTETSQPAADAADGSTTTDADGGPGPAVETAEQSTGDDTTNKTSNTSGETPTVAADFDPARDTSDI
ncbi:hypothetical protein B0T17DRAFT_530724 [Bombardia bombarda]|uniref:Uncharacterized protein n=1 Tax=Bombardia bombarda TaxID=252184 RepID=A0AA39WZS4_9PEZI|nr:hypothetical protein B0T17DRAFT_530724 [Bombardia bombarda]